MGFEITVLGCSGGPVEGSTCSLLIKPLGISYSEVLEQDLRHQLICVDAGSGLRLLAEILYKQRHGADSTIDYLYDTLLNLSHAFATPTSNPFASLVQNHSPFYLSQQIIEHIEAYLLSHPHLDHTAALVLNSAGTVNCDTKTVYGSLWTLDALQKHIFNNVIWPDMPSYRKLDLVHQPYNTEFYTTDNVYSITMFELSHGPCKLGDLAQVPRYQLLAFLITHTETKCSVIVFGDFECDAVSGRNLNHAIWAKLAPLILNKNNLLSAIVLECSNSSATLDTELYGHILSVHLIRELQVLQSECNKLKPTELQPLKGLNVIITHVKEASYDPKNTNVDSRDPRINILNELRQFNQDLNMGLLISAAVTGITLVV